MRWLFFVRSSSDCNNLIADCCCTRICSADTSAIRDQAGRAEHFRKAASVAPLYELASLGLFHTLFEAGRVEEALEEMVRYLRNKDSAEYRELLSGDGFSDELPPMQRTLAKQARELLLAHGRKN